MIPKVAKDEKDCSSEKIDTMSDYTLISEKEPITPQARDLEANKGDVKGQQNNTRRKFVLSLHMVLVVVTLTFFGVCLYQDMKSSIFVAKKTPVAEKRPCHMMNN